MKDDFDDAFLRENFEGDELNTTRTPQYNEGSTLRERLNPEKEIRSFKLALMGAYEIKKMETDGDGEDREVTRVRRMKNFKPIINKQGIEEVTDYLKNLVNSHTFQSNFVNKEDYNATCKFTFNMMAVNFISKRREWSVKIGDKMPLIDYRFIYCKAKNIAKLGLRRALDDAERKHLGETVKESISVSDTPREKTNLLQKVAGVLGK